MESDTGYHCVTGLGIGINEIDFGGAKTSCYQNFAVFNVMSFPEQY